MEEEKTPKISVWDLPDVPKGKLPAHLELQRTRVICTPDAATNVLTQDPIFNLFSTLGLNVCMIIYYYYFLELKTENIRYSGAYASMGVDNSLRLGHFRDNFRVEVVRLTEDDMEFDMIGIDASLANAFRRILLAEVCAMFLRSFFLSIVILPTYN